MQRNQTLGGFQTVENSFILTGKQRQVVSSIAEIPDRGFFFQQKRNISPTSIAKTVSTFAETSGQLKIPFILPFRLCFPSRPRLTRNRIFSTLTITYYQVPVLVGTFVPLRDRSDIRKPLFLNHSDTTPESDCLYVVQTCV